MVQWRLAEETPEGKGVRQVDQRLLTCRAENKVPCLRGCLAAAASVLQQRGETTAVYTKKLWYCSFPSGWFLCLVNLCR